MLATDAPLRRLTLDDVQRMSEAGILGELERVELIDGVLYDVMAPSPKHSAIVSWLNRHLVLGCPDREVRIQDMLVIEGGFLMPDVMVLEPLDREDYATTAVVVVEVSVTMRRHDTAKAALYARAAVSEYWIVDTPERVVRVHREPRPDGYARVGEHRDGEHLPVAADAPSVPVSELLGPAAR